MKNHESVRKVAEIAIKLRNNGHYTQYTICLLFVLQFAQYLAFKGAFKIFAPVNRGMSDWFIRNRFLGKILQMEITVHTLCSVQCSGLCQVEVSLTF